MAQIGCLGEIPFLVSSEAVQTISNAVWSGSARYGEHQRHLTNALTEFTGIDPDTFSFDMMLSAYLGVNPMDAINTLWRYERQGIAVQLTIGSKGYGKYRWTVKKHKIKMNYYDGSGDLTAATVSVDLLEYLK